MEPQNNEILSFLLNSINTFLESSQNLEEELLGQFVSLIEATYTTKNNKERKEREEMLNQTRRSVGWKKYLLSLFQIVYFSDSVNQTTVERILHEVEQFIKTEKAYVAIDTQEFLVLLAANICCLINKDCSVKIKKIYLLSIIDHLFDLNIDKKGKAI